MKESFEKKSAATPLIPDIAPVAAGIRRPRWSVMIPNYNSGEYLRKTIQSVMVQDRGPEQMEIEVVDHCSNKGDPEALVKEVGGDRVAFYRRPRNEGPIANFNACIKRSHGYLIHILHSDDYVLPGFYTEIEQLAEQCPQASLLATRCFIVDQNDIILSVSARISELEEGGLSAKAQYYETSMQFPGVVIKRSFYEAHGGYMSSMGHVTDREMWVRGISLGGGILSTNVLACYRYSSSNDTAALLRSGENVRDLMRLSDVFRSRYPDYSRDYARKIAAHMALDQAKKFSTLNDHESARKNLQIWSENSTWTERLKETVRPLLFWLLHGKRYI